MIVLPLIARELQVEARRPFTHWLRVVGAGTLLLGAGLLWESEGLHPGKGGALFSTLHTTLFWTIWVVVPVMTADCISREKREGTLGLLFLTPLRPLDVVLAKILAHSLRAAALVLAAFPLLTIPFLYGGVIWQEAVASALINFSAFCWALAAGVIASSSNTHLNRALVLAGLWSVFFFLLLTLLQGLSLFAAFQKSFPGWMKGHNSFPSMLATLLTDGLRVVFNFDWLWTTGWTRGNAAAFASNWVLNLGIMAAISFLAQLFVLLFAARNVRGIWQDKAPSPRQEKLKQQLYAPRFGQQIFRRWMRRLLEQNPVGWLERRTWSSRVVMWGWLAVMISFYSAALGSPLSYARELDSIQGAVVIMFLLSIALSAAGSFRRERETGLLELMLVTPLRVGQIVNGRLRALWGQFLPASILFVAVWVFIVREFSRAGLSAGSPEDQQIWLCLFCSSALTLPAIGLWCSLHFRLFIVSLFGTATLGVFLPLVIVAALRRWGDQGQFMWSGILFLALLGTLGWALVWRRHSLRDYSGAIRAPILAGISAMLAAFLVAQWEKNVPFRETFEVIPGLFGLVALQLSIATLLLVRLHRALVRRKFAFPQ